MPDEVEIRPVTRADLAALRAMLVETWHATYDAIYGATRVTEITTRWHSIEQLEAGLGQDRVALIAVRGSAIVGHCYVSVLADQPRTAKLWRLYVVPAQQGRGIGQRLLEAGFAAAPAHDRRVVDVEPANSRAIGFYGRCGFVAIEASPASRDTPGAIVMACEL
jgi:ribosomal protein S18 acetylase RimI-like enzyme